MMALEMVVPSMEVWLELEKLGKFFKGKLHFRCILRRTPKFSKLSI
jgi:hypothetical protein